MTSRYEVEPVSIKEKDSLMEKYVERLLYEERADIYGCCIKLLTDIKICERRLGGKLLPHVCACSLSGKTYRH